MFEDQDVQLYNIHGDLVFNGKVSNLNLEEFPSGIYFRRERTCTGHFHTSKIAIK